MGAGKRKRRRADPGQEGRPGHVGRVRDHAPTEVVVVKTVAGWAMFATYCYTDVQYTPCHVHKSDRG